MTQYDPDLSASITATGQHLIRELAERSGMTQYVAAHNKYLERFAEMLIKECADVADAAYDARCKFPGDYIVESLGFGEEEGAATWRCK